MTPFATMARDAPLELLRAHSRSQGGQYHSCQGAELKAPFSRRTTTSGGRERACVRLRLKLPRAVQHVQSTYEERKVEREIIEKADIVVVV